MIWCYSCKQCRQTFRSKIMQFFTISNLNKIILFSCWTLCFDLCASLIFLVLCGTNKVLKAILLLFCSNFFQSFEWWKTYFFPIILINKRFNFRYSFSMTFNLFHDLMQRLKHTESNYHHFFWIYCCFLIF